MRAAPGWLQRCAALQLRRFSAERLRCFLAARRPLWRQLRNIKAYLDIMAGLTAGALASVSGAEGCADCAGLWS